MDDAEQPRTEEARAFLDTVRRAVLDPSIAKLIGPDGREELVAFVSPDAIRRTLIAVEKAAGRALDPDALARLLERHELQTDYGYEEQECSCGEWRSSFADEGPSWAEHVVAASRSEGRAEGREGRL